MEKMRRAKINHYLGQLSTLISEWREKEVSIINNSHHQIYIVTEPSQFTNYRGTSSRSSSNDVENNN